MTVAFYTLGCKVNQYETEILMDKFMENGFDIVTPDGMADVYVINSCTVTAMSDKKVRQAVRRFAKQSPQAIIALTGCFPQAFPNQAELLPEARVITGSYNRASLIDSIKETMLTGERVINITPHKKGEAFEKMSAKKLMDRTRAFVKIQDGCQRYCSYCIIPTARGPIRSKPMEDLKKELKNIAENGNKEVVLVGINLSMYGAEYGLRLIDAVEAACTTEGIERVRLGSLEPELITYDDVQRLKLQPKFCPQFHLSLQSGCDETLKRMNRHYTAQQYMDIVNMLRDNIEDTAITTDIMVGFPGETEEEFSKTLDFVEQVGFANAHVFAYSKRPGTKAFDMPGQVLKSKKEERSKRLIAKVSELHKDFIKNQINSTQSVLFETKNCDNMYEGYTKNYSLVKVKSQENLCGQIKNVKISSIQDDYCIGELI